MTDVMTPLERVYSLEASVRLNFATMMEIYKSGGLLQSQPKRSWTSVALACAWPHAFLDSFMRKPIDLLAPAVCMALRIPRAGLARADMQGDGGNAKRVDNVACRVYAHPGVRERPSRHHRHPVH